MIYLIVPKIGESPAGGSIYNDFLTRSNPELKLVEVLELDSFQDQILEDAILIVDSLLLISYCDKGYHKQYRTIGLIHLPTFLDQRNTDRALVKKELSYLSLLSIIVTGHRFKQDLVNTYGLKGDSIYCVSPGVSRLMKKVDYAKTAQKLLIIASVTRRKEILKAIQTLDQLRVENWTLTVYGEIVDQEYYDAIIAFTEESGISDKVEFKGYLNQEELWQSAVNYDLMLNFSRYETFGMAIFEALQSGIPVLSVGTELDPVLTKNKNFRSFADTTSFKLELERLMIDPEVYLAYQSLPNSHRDWKLVQQEFNQAVVKIKESNQW